MNFCQICFTKRSSEPGNSDNWSYASRLLFQLHPVASQGYLESPLPTIKIYCFSPNESSACKLNGIWYNLQDVYLSVQNGKERSSDLLFNSFHYLIFFPTMFTLYWVSKNKYRWIILLVGSYYFYMCWRPEYALLLLFSTFSSYLFGILIDKYRKQGKLFVWLNSILCFSLLCYC